MRILLIEDDMNLVWAVKSRMEQDGYIIDNESSGQAGLDRAETTSYNLIILDIMLPELNGFEVCRQIRNKGILTPILILTARSQEGDKVLGLDSGADDYLSKPFSYPELFARVRALIRRTYLNPSSEIKIGDLCIDTTKKTVNYRNNPISLTLKEYCILEYLAYNKNGVVTKSMLEERIWGDDNHIYSNVIEVLISRLRSKLNASDKEALIKTVRNLGYIIRDENA